MTLDDFCNEPAFPENVSVSDWVNSDGSPDGRVIRSEKKGLTRLEFFTAMAMNKPDPAQSALSVVMELYMVRNKGAAERLKFIS